jgi:hypothetical protein
MNAIPHGTGQLEKVTQCDVKRLIWVCLDSKGSLKTWFVTERSVASSCKTLCTLTMWLLWQMESRSAWQTMIRFHNTIFQARGRNHSGCSVPSIRTIHIEVSLLTSPLCCSILSSLSSCGYPPLARSMLIVLPPVY